MQHLTIWSHNTSHRESIRVAALNQNLNRALDLLELNAGERNQLPRLLQEDFEQVLRRPIETTPLIGSWRFAPRGSEFHIPNRRISAKLFSAALFKFASLGARPPDLYPTVRRSWLRHRRFSQYWGVVLSEARVLGLKDSRQSKKLSERARTNLHAGIASCLPARLQQTRRS
jgi:hypothetical protein